jgi:hypothetical protein
VHIAQKNPSTSMVRLERNAHIEYVAPNEALKVIKGIHVELHTKRLPYKTDSMFYYGKHIATVSNEKRTLIVESAGEMRAAFSVDGNSYQNEDLAKQLKRRKITNSGLGKLGMDDLIQMNNWFRIIDADTDEEMGIAHNYDDAITVAKNCLK